MITASIAICARGEEQERTVNQAMEAVEKIEGVVKGKKLFGGESIGYLDICLGWMSYWLPVWEEVGGIADHRSHQVSRHQFMDEHIS